MDKSGYSRIYPSSIIIELKKVDWCEKCGKYTITGKKICNKCLNETRKEKLNKLSNL